METIIQNEIIIVMTDIIKKIEIKKNVQTIKKCIEIQRKEKKRLRGH